MWGRSWWGLFRRLLRKSMRFLELTLKSLTMIRPTCGSSHSMITWSLMLNGLFMRLWRRICRALSSVLISIRTSSSSSTKSKELTHSWTRSPWSVRNSKLRLTDSTKQSMISGNVVLSKSACPCSLCNVTSWTKLLLLSVKILSKRSSTQQLCGFTKTPLKRSNKTSSICSAASPPKPKPPPN